MHSQVYQAGQPIKFAELQTSAQSTNAPRPRTIAYEFRPGFEPAIMKGEKRQTFRRIHEEYETPPVPGDKLIAWVASSNTLVKILKEVVITQVLPFFVDVNEPEPIWLDGVPLNRKQLEQFARDEGFVTYHQMRIFIKDQYGQQMWRGVVIKWG